MDSQAVVQHSDLGWHGVSFRMADRLPVIAWHSRCRLCRFAFRPERLWNNVLPKPCAVMHHAFFLKRRINSLLHSMKRSHPAPRAARVAKSTERQLQRLSSISGRPTSDTPLACTLKNTRLHTRFCVGTGFSRGNGRGHPPVRPSPPAGVYKQAVRGHASVHCVGGPRAWGPESVGVVLNSTGDLFRAWGSGGCAFG